VFKFSSLDVCYVIGATVTGYRITPLGNPYGVSFFNRKRKKEKTNTEIEKRKNKT
jgi:hypothetical protein